MPVVSVRVSRDTYEKLRKMALEKGLSPYEYVKRVLETHVSSEVSYPEVSYRDSASKLSQSKLLHEERKLSQSKLSELTSEQLQGAQNPQVATERAVDVLKKVAEVVKKHDEVVNRLNEGVALMGLALFGVRDIDKAVQVAVGDELPEELRGKQPIECSRGDGIEVEVYEY